MVPKLLAHRSQVKFVIFLKQFSLQRNMIEDFFASKDGRGPDQNRSLPHLALRRMRINSGDPLDGTAKTEIPQAYTSRSGTIKIPPLFKSADDDSLTLNVK